MPNRVAGGSRGRRNRTNDAHPFLWAPANRPKTAALGFAFLRPHTEHCPLYTTLLPRPPFSAPKLWARGGRGEEAEEEGRGWSIVDDQDSALQVHYTSYKPPLTITKSTESRELTYFCFPSPPKGNRKTVSGQAKKRRTRGTWADTGS